MVAGEKRLYRLGKGISAPLWFLVVLLLSVGFVSAATVTINTPSSNAIQSASVAGDGENITTSVTVALGAGDLEGNVSNVSYYYRATSGAAWTLIGTNISSNLTTFLFPWNISNLADGVAYEFNATVFNLTELIGSVTTTSIIIDNTPPKVKVEILDSIQKKVISKVFYSDSAIIRCTREDATAGYNHTNVSIQVPGSLVLEKLEETTEEKTVSADFDATFINTRVIGIFFSLCTVRDKAGNVNNTANATFEIVPKPPSGGSPFANPDFKSPVATTIVGASAISNLGDLTEVGISRLIAETGTVVMTVHGEEHRMTVSTITDKTGATFTIDTGFDVSLDSGEVKGVDVDADGVDDVSIELHQIFKKKADTTFKLLPLQAAPPVVAPEGEVVPEVVQAPIIEKAKSWLVIVLSIVVVVLIVFVVLHYLAGKESGGGPSGKSSVAFTKKDLGAYRHQGAASMSTRNNSGYRPPSNPRQY